MVAIRPPQLSSCHQAHRNSTHGFVSVTFNSKNRWTAKLSADSRRPAVWLKSESILKQRYPKVSATNTCLPAVPSNGTAPLLVSDTLLDILVQPSSIALVSRKIPQDQPVLRTGWHLLEKPQLPETPQKTRVTQARHGTFAGNYETHCRICDR